MNKSDLMWLFPGYEKDAELICLDCNIAFHRDDLKDHVHYKKDRDRE